MFSWFVRRSFSFFKAIRALQATLLKATRLRAILLKDTRLKVILLRDTLLKATLLRVTLLKAIRLKDIPATPHLAATLRLEDILAHRECPECPA
jgi:hypothetical protein